MPDYGFVKILDMSLDQALDTATARLAEEGFGVLTRIDVHEKLEEKLGVQVPPYVILGACHPASAHAVLQKEPDIGLMLPCNVCVYQDAEGRTVLAVMRPEAAMQAVGNPELADVAADIERRLKHVFESIG